MPMDNMLKHGKLEIEMSGDDTDLKQDVLKEIIQAMRERQGMRLPGKKMAEELVEGSGGSDIAMEMGADDAMGEGEMGDDEKRLLEEAFR